MIIISMLGMSVSAAVEIDLLGLVGTILLAMSFIPLGIQFLRRDLE